jgi:hypothetical protein
VRAGLTIGFWFLIQVVQSVVSVLELAPQENVAFLAHAIGFVFGVIAVGAIREARGQTVSHWEEGPQRWWNRSFRNWILLALLVVGGFFTVQFVAATGNEALAALLQLALLIGIAFVAIGDGWLRLMGRDALLGSTQRAERVVAVVQIIAGLSLISGAFVV